MQTFSALLALWAGNSPVTGEFPAQRPLTRSFDVFFDMHLNERWVNNREASDLKRHGAHYDVIVMGVSVTSGFLHWLWDNDYFTSAGAGEATLKSLVNK